VPHNAVPNAKPMAVPGKMPTATPHETEHTPSIIQRAKQWLFGGKGNTEKVIEPGIRNKEVEAYRTKDAKEVEYKDAIKQDDKNITLPKHRIK
jgi:hypothetical protein